MDNQPPSLMGKIEEDEFTKKIAELSSKVDYEHPRVSPEGYGTFIRSESGPGQPLHNRMKLLRQKAETLKSTDSIPLYIEAIFYQLKAHLQQDKSIVSEYMGSLRQLIKATDHALTQAKDCKCDKAANALGWLLFNLKMFKLLKESELFGRHADQANYVYIIEVLKVLNTYYDSSSADGIELVSIEDLEEGVKKRL